MLEVYENVELTTLFAHRNYVGYPYGISDWIDDTQLHQFLNFLGDDWLKNSVHYPLFLSKHLDSWL